MQAPRCARALVAALLAVAGATSAEATSVVIQPSNQDASIFQDAPNRPKGSGTNNTRFHVRTSTVNPRVRRGLVQFNISAVPQFSQVNSATLSLYQDSSPVGPHVNDVHRINDAWLQSTVKWNTQPTIEALATSTANVGTVRQFWDWLNVTDDVQAWVDSPASNHGWLVKDAAETGTNDIIAYVSAEEFTNPDLPKRPKLTVDFTAPPCSTNADCVEEPDNPCTVNERCEAGHCAVDAATCDDGNACTDDICDPEQGCLHPVGECNDGFSCTIDSCDPQGGCIHTVVASVCAHDGCQTGTCVADQDDEDLDPVTGCLVTSVAADGAGCTADGSECTSDVCASGECTHPDAPLNTPCSADGNPCTDDVCDGNGVCHVNNTGPCTDNDECTVGDQCSGGGCVSGAPVVCTAAGQCFDVGTCDPQTGICSNPPKSPGTGCNDNDACTQPDECDGAGTCVGGNPVVCTPLNQCHDAGTCDPQTGICSNPEKPDGTGCVDGDACTQTDQCAAGQCVGSNDVVCTAAGQCFDVGTCDPQTGICSNPPKTSGAGCDDTDACTQTDACDGAGTCVGANPIVCTALGQCYDVGTCDPQTGVCSDPPKSNGAGCDDSDACTQTDACDGAGTCVGGNPVVCTALDQCHDPGTCDSQTGQCSDPDKPDGTGCDDGNGCTLTDQCTGGICGGNPLTCGDGIVQTNCNEECDTMGALDQNCTAQCQFICDPTPQAGCRRPRVSAKAFLLMKNRTPDKKDAITWKWVKGATTSIPDFGTPLTSTTYAICVYDQSANPQPRVFALAPPGGLCAGKPCWKTTKKGFKYKDKVLDPDGVLSMILQSGVDSKAKAIVKGKGVNLAMPPAAPLTLPATVQLKRNDNPGICWDAVYSNPEKNLADQFKGVAD